MWNINPRLIIHARKPCLIIFVFLSLIMINYLVTVVLIKSHISTAMIAYLICISPCTYFSIKTFAPIYKKTKYSLPISQLNEPGFVKM